MACECNNANSHVCTCHNCKTNKNEKKEKETCLTIRDVKDVIQTATAGVLLIKAVRDVWKIFKK